MSKTLIGIVTFGGLNFTKLCVKGIQETVTKDHDLCVIIGKPDDAETLSWLYEDKFHTKVHWVFHTDNKGFPASVNDIYDVAWKTFNYDNLVMIGNDVIPYPYAIDSLIDVADNTNNEWVCSREYSVKNLVNEFPQTKMYFQGESMVYNFEGEPWKLYPRLEKEISLSNAAMSDVHNLALYKKSVMDKIGYIDVNFYPAYYEDNDYARRGVNAKINSCTLINSIYFHFWSRTIKQGSGGSDNKYFELNRSFYIKKWGGDFGKETWKVPFNGAPYYNLGELNLENQGLNIQDRNYELDSIKYWKEQHG